MMKKLLCLTAVLVLALGFSAQSATVLLLNFDSAAIVDDATYDFGPADIPASGTGVNIHFYNPPPGFPNGSARDYGFTDVAQTVDTGNYPDIVTPAAAGFQGGNVLFTCVGDATDPQQHIGWHIQQADIPSVSGDFTAEAIFMLARIGTPSDPVVDSEYSLHNIFGTDMISGVGATTSGSVGAAWKFRVWPNGLIGGTGQLQLWTGNTATGGAEVDVDGPNMSINTWYHVACVYTRSTNTIEFFLNGTSLGTNNPAWGDLNQDDWWVGAWPSNGANRGLAGWIDAVALSDTPLGPGTFVLPTASDVSDWNQY